MNESQEIKQRALALLEQDGWVKNSFGIGGPQQADDPSTKLYASSGAPPGHCLVAALCRAHEPPIDPWDLGGGYTPEGWTDDIDDTVSDVLDAVLDSDKSRELNMFSAPWEEIGVWQDGEAVGFEDVRAVLLHEGRREPSEGAEL